jgi:hypothetical protein
LNWCEIFELLAVMAVILVAYFALPSRYHLNPDWQEAALIVMLTSVGLAPEVNPDYLKTAPDPCINLPTDQVPDTPPTPGPTPQPRGPTIIAAGLLLAALALVVLYTSRRAFLSPVAMVVVAAIGLAALLLQRRLHPDLRPDLRSDLGPGASPAARPSSPQASPARAPLRLNAAGVLFAIAAVFADVLHLNPALTLITALAAVISFAISGVIVLNALRKPRP